MYGVFWKWLTGHEMLIIMINTVASLGFLGAAESAMMIGQNTC